MSTGSDEKISAAKITPLESSTKQGVEHEMSNRGAAGSDTNIDKARVDPIGGAGHHQTTAPHADSQGSIGPDKNIQHAKIEPLDGQAGHTKAQSGDEQTGLPKEAVDSARIAPLGEVREEMKPQ